MMEDYVTQPILDAVARVRPLAKRANCTLAQLALAWAIREDVVSSAIVGASRPEQLDETLAAADLDIDPAIFAEMSQILFPVAPYEPYSA
jgi:aryl-alcohol dehydrogenase-like predicted oxidoreductase